MDSSRGNSTDNGRWPINRGNGSARLASDEPKIERRSPTRPQFVEGWQKLLKKKLAQARAAPPSTAEPTGQIDIWVANPVELLRADSCLQLLSGDDWTSINQIQDPTSRRSSIAARILLRIGLSHAANHKIPPSDWRFSTAAHHKPIVADGLPPINFSTSHVDQLVAVAISSTRDVGIDVECIDQNVGKKVIADFTHLDEQHSVGGLPRPQEIREFVRLWTLKEAYTKMIGVGHTLDFKTLRFTLDPVDLSSAGDDPKMARAMQFDNFYVSYKHSLFNASLAIRHPVGSVGATKIQIISLAGTAEDNAAT